MRSWNEKPSIWQCASFCSCIKLIFVKTATTVTKPTGRDTFMPLQSMIPCRVFYYVQKFSKLSQLLKLRLKGDLSKFLVDWVFLHIPYTASLLWNVGYHWLYMLASRKCLQGTNLQGHCKSLKLNHGTLFVFLCPCWHFSLHPFNLKYNALNPEP